VVIVVREGIEAVVIPELLLSIGDCDENWRQIFTIVRDFESEQIRSLTKPIELNGGSGPNCYVFG
jgi:hypothetical protein